MDRIADWEVYAPHAAHVFFEARIQLGLSIQAVARATELSPYTYRRMEDPELCTRLPHRPTVESIERLCKVLELDPARLSHSSWTTELIGGWRSTPGLSSV